MENTLNIQITLNDEQLKSLIMDNINELPKEKLQDVLLQAIKEVLTSEDGKQLFIVKEGYYTNSNIKPSRWLETLVKQTNISETISPTINQVVAEFVTHYPDILERCLKTSITSMFMNEMSRCRLEQAWDMAQSTLKGN